MAPRLNDLVNSEQFGVAVGLLSRVQREVQGRAQRDTRRFLHLFNLPAGSDVTRILNEIGSLQRQVRELTKQVDAAKETRPNGTTPGNERPAGAGKARR